MRLLLTGSTGFVGRNLLLHFLKENKYEEILLPVRSEKKLRAQLKEEGISELPRQIKVLNKEAPLWDFSDCGEIDHVVHGAGVLFGNTIEEYRYTNTQGTLNLVSSLKNPKKVIILSSQAASGPCLDLLQLKTELDNDNPITWYGTSKLEMETQIRKAFPHLELVFLRPPMILGPRDTATLALFKMARGFVQFKPGFKPKHYSFIGVNDLVMAVSSILDQSEPKEKKGRMQPHYFVAHETPISDLDLIRTATLVCGKRSRVVPIPQDFLRGVSRLVDAVPVWRKALPSLSKDRAKEIWPDRWVISPKAFQESYGWRAKQNLQDALLATYEWYRKTGQL